MERSFTCSHPGQFAVGDVELGNGHKLTLISLYGIWDRMEDSGDLYVDATLHRGDLRPNYYFSGAFLRVRPNRR